MHPAMAVTIHRSTSYSSGSVARSVVGVASSGQSISGGFGTDIDFSSSFSPSYELSVFGNEKLTMQNLNSRLASYLEKVLSLENANQKLEQKIKEFYESRTPTSSKDLNPYWNIIKDLKEQISSMVKKTHKALMDLENTNLAAADFKMKFESEKNMCLSGEAQLAHLRTVLNGTKMAKDDLKIQLSELNEELLFLKKSHEDDLIGLRTQQNGSVNVQIDCAPSVNFEKELEEMRKQYEALILKNLKEIEMWSKNEVNNLNTKVVKSHTEIKSTKTEFTELKKTYQSLDIQIKGIRTKIQMLQGDLAQVGGRSGEQLCHLQLRIDQLQTELQQITASMQQQAMEYQLLLDIKMRLELEISEYRRLLGGDGHGYSIHETDMSALTTVSRTVTQTVVEEKEEEHHLHQRRVKIITEELVDGVVVSTVTDERVQDLAN